MTSGYALVKDYFHDPLNIYKRNYICNGAKIQPHSNMTCITTLSSRPLPCHVCYPCSGKFHVVDSTLVTGAIVNQSHSSGKKC